MSVTSLIQTSEVEETVRGRIYRQQDGWKRCHFYLNSFLPVCLIKMLHAHVHKHKSTMILAHLCAHLSVCLSDIQDFHYHDIWRTSGCFLPVWLTNILLMCLCAQKQHRFWPALISAILGPSVRVFVWFPRLSSALWTRGWMLVLFL